MPFPRIGGGGLPLTLQGNLNNYITLQAGSAYMLPAGFYDVRLGPYTSLQSWDPITGIWRNVSAENSLFPMNINADGANVRIANLTGCVMGALITNAGSGYTNGIGTAATGLTITPSAGASVWVPVVGGAINSTVTITAAGTLYTKAPAIIFSPPPAGGVTATGYVTISAGAIATVVVTNQGAGYTAAPTITIVNDPRDTTGSGGILTVNATLVGSGALTAMYPSDNGNPVTAIVTFTFSPASTTAATAIMNWTVTGLTVTGGGVAVPAGSLLFGCFGAITAGSRAANTAGPINDTGLVQPRPVIISPSISGGVIQAGGHVIIDAGFGLQAVPTLGLISSTGVAPTTGTNITALVGGTLDTSYIMPY